MYEFVFKIKSDHEVIDVLKGRLILDIGGYDCPIDRPNLSEVTDLIKGLYHLNKEDKVLITEVSKYPDTIGHVCTEDLMDEEDYESLKELKHLEHENEINIDRFNYFQRKGDTIKSDNYKKMIEENNKSIEKLNSLLYK